MSKLSENIGKSKNDNSILFFIIGGVLIGIIIGFFLRNSHQIINTIVNTKTSSALAVLGVVIGWMFAIFIFILELHILRLMWLGTSGNKETGINLAKLISEENGDASLSRFQLLIFTFVISMSLILIIASHTPGPAFPDKIPPEILGLLGISGATYAIAKGIQASKDPEIIRANAEADVINAKTEKLNSTNGITANQDGSTQETNMSGG